MKRMKGILPLDKSQSQNQKIVLQMLRYVSVNYAINIVKTFPITINFVQ